MKITFCEGVCVLLCQMHYLSFNAAEKKCGCGNIEI